MFKRINITLSDDVLVRADEFARRERYTRSGLIAAALEAFTGGDAASAETGGASLATEASAAYGATVARDLSLERLSALLRAFFSARDDVEAAWVFGSVVRGTAGPMSDVDVAVLPKGRPDGDARWDMRVDLMSRLPGAVGTREVDVAVFPDVSVQLGYTIVSEGVQVFGEGSRAAADVQLAALNSYWEFEEVRRTARAALGERMRAYGAR